jgi:hypothetical protein
MESFAFSIPQWRAACRPPATPTEGACITLLLDPAPTAGPQSDDSSFACGYISEEFPKTLTVLDIASAKWRGGALADETLELIETHKPRLFAYENNPGMDWFRELLILKAERRGIAVPHIDAFTPYNGRAAKEKRICRLQTLFDCDPPSIVFQSGSYCEQLFRAAERFQVGGDKKGQENGRLDSLALLAGFR